MPSTRILRTVLAAALAASGAARAEDAPEPGAGHAPQVADLGLGDFFSAGWDQPWVHRHDRYTPDMALLRVITNALEQEFRLDGTSTDVRGNPKVQTSSFLNGLLAYAVNRRLMLEVIDNAQWNKDFAGTTSSGGGGGGLVRLMLVDTQQSCTSFQVKVTAPNKGLGQTQTTVSYGLASWQDLHALFPVLGRTGLYESLQYDKLDGPAKAGAKSKGTSADVSLAHTWTGAEDRPFAKLTTFAEFYANRDLDGPLSGQTLASVTPAVRAWLSPKQSLTLGEDLPMGRRGGFYRVLRLTYILNF